MHRPLVARILLVSLKRIPHPNISLYLTKFFILHTCYLTILACLQQDSCQMSNLYPFIPNVFSVIFHPLTPNLPFGYESLLVHAVFRSESGYTEVSLPHSSSS